MPASSLGVMCVHCARKLPVDCAASPLPFTVRVQCPKCKGWNSVRLALKETRSVTLDPEVSAG